MVNSYSDPAPVERFHRVADSATYTLVLDSDPMRVFGDRECTCERDPLGVCEHCGPAPSDSVWNATLGDVMQELSDPALYRRVFGLCVSCGSDDPEDGQLCYGCEQERRVDREMFLRGIV